MEKNSKIGFAFLQEPKDKSIMEQIDLFRDYVIDTSKESKTTIKQHFKNLEKGLTHPEIKQLATEFHKNQNTGLLNKLTNSTQKSLTDALVGMYTTSLKTSTIIPQQAERLVQNSVAKSEIGKEASRLLKGEKPFEIKMITEEGKQMRNEIFKGRQEIAKLNIERDSLKKDNNLIKRAYDNIIGNLKGEHKMTADQIQDLHKDVKKESSKSQDLTR